MTDYFEKYAYRPTVESINAFLSEIDNIKESYATKENYAKCLSLVDLTTLNGSDTDARAISFAQKVNGFDSFAKTLDTPVPLPNVAAICVYPSLVASVREALETPQVKIAAVGAGFPASQTFEEIKALECALCVSRGADEIDIVISLRHFMAGNYLDVYKEIGQIRSTIDSAGGSRNIRLKVILESGTLEDPLKIARASFLAMEAGADFIKTSTGKVSPAATPQAAVVMCNCIKSFYQQTGKKMGFKPAGGITTANQAIEYLAIVTEILGPEWVTPSLMRFGASRMANNLLGAITEKETVYF